MLVVCIHSLLLLAESVPVTSQSVVPMNVGMMVVMVVAVMVVMVGYYAQQPFELSAAE